MIAAVASMTPSTPTPFACRYRKHWLWSALRRDIDGSAQLILSRSLITEKQAMLIGVLAGGCNTWKRTASDMAPRWTGRWGALATSAPSGPNMAQEKSRRSLMLTLMLVRWSARPICSAIPMNLQCFTAFQGADLIADHLMALLTCPLL